MKYFAACFVGMQLINSCWSRYTNYIRNTSRTLTNRSTTQTQTVTDADSNGNTTSNTNSNTSSNRNSNTVGATSSSKTTNSNTNSNTTRDHWVSSIFSYYYPWDLKWINFKSPIVEYDKKSKTSSRSSAKPEGRVNGPGESAAASENPDSSIANSGVALRSDNLEDSDEQVPDDLQKSDSKTVGRGSRLEAPVEQETRAQSQTNWNYPVRRNYFNTIMSAATSGDLDLSDHHDSPNGSSNIVIPRQRRFPQIVGVGNKTDWKQDDSTKSGKDAKVDVVASPNHIASKFNDVDDFSNSNNLNNRNNFEDHLQITRQTEKKDSDFPNSNNFTNNANNFEDHLQGKNLKAEKEADFLPAPNFSKKWERGISEETLQTTQSTSASSLSAHSNYEHQKGQEGNQAGIMLENPNNSSDNAEERSSDGSNCYYRLFGPYGGGASPRSRSKMSHPSLLESAPSLLESSASRLGMLLGHNTTTGGGGDSKSISGTVNEKKGDTDWGNTNNSDTTAVLNGKANTAAKNGNKENDISPICLLDEDEEDEVDSNLASPGPENQGRRGPSPQGLNLPILNPMNLFKSDLVRTGCGLWEII